MWSGPPRRPADARFPVSPCLLDPRVRQAWRGRLLAELPPAPAAIADLGCGTGTLSVLLAAEG
jgi:methylase of polypeptide subunit release factors